MDDKDKIIIEKEKAIIGHQSTIQLLFVVLAISLIINLILAFTFFQVEEETNDEIPNIIIEQHDAPITIYNNMTLIQNGNETRSGEIIEPDNLPS